MADEIAAENKREAKGKRAVAAGHICIDITPLFPKGSTGEAGRILAPGQLVQMEGVNIHPGGAVANTGLAMKHLGVDVRLMGMEKMNWEPLSLTVWRNTGRLRE